VYTGVYVIIYSVSVAIYAAMCTYSVCYMYTAVCVVEFVTNPGSFTVSLDESTRAKAKLYCTTLAAMVVIAGGSGLSWAHASEKCCGNPLYDNIVSPLTKDGPVAGRVSPSKKHWCRAAGPLEFYDPAGPGPFGPMMMCARLDRAETPHWCRDQDSILGRIRTSCTQLELRTLSREIVASLKMRDNRPFYEKCWFD
jgi:hypothetical protein